MTATVLLTALHTIPQWKPQTDASVADNPAKAFTMSLGAVPWLPSAALISITGVPGKYTGGMASKSVPLPLSPATGQPVTNAKMTVGFMLDSDSQTAAMQAMEFGAKITDAHGVTYNPNLQLDNSESATQTVLTVVNAAYKWSVVPNAAVPRLAPNTLHTVVEEFSWASGKMCVTRITVDGVSFPVPQSLQNLAGQSLGWQPSILTACIQPDVNTQGGSYTMLVTQFDVETW